jgi:hypothetical protein
LYIRLDAIHKLVLSKSTWTLYKCVRKGPYNKELHDKLIKEKKQVVILVDKQDNKGFATWKALGTYPIGDISNAIMKWIYNTVGLAYRDKQLEIDGIVAIFNSMKKAISGAILMSSIFRLRIDFDGVPPDVLKKLEQEKKDNTILTQSDRKKGRMIKDLVGPDTVLTSIVSDNAADPTIAGFRFELDKDTNEIKLIKDTTITIEKQISNISYYPDIRTELVAVEDITPGVFGRKRKAGTTELVVSDLEPIKKKHKKHKHKKHGSGSLSGLL